METFGAMAKTEKIAFILEQVCDFFYLHLYPGTILEWRIWTDVLVVLIFHFIGSSVFRSPGLRTCTNTFKEDKS